jgi:SsrA-binding protein
MVEQHDKTKLIARNRKAMRNYQILDRFEAGIELLGCEVKSLREGRLNLGDAYAIVKDGEVFLKNLHITPYKMTADEPPDPLRPRRLLLHRREIRRLKTKTEQRGMTIIPLTLYFKGNLAKVELGLGIGRRKYDKRDVIAKADADRRIKQAMRKDFKR